MKEIVVIAPVNFMNEPTRLLIAGNGYNNVELLEGERRSGIELTRLAIAGGAKVIISRGGTYEMIKSEFDIPVVEVKVTAFDLIESFKAVLQTGRNGPIGVIGYRNVIAGAPVIAEVMGLQALCFEITDKRGIPAEVERQIAQGVRVFMGDGNVVGAVAKHGCRSVLVQSGSQAMQNAIEQAKGIIYAAQQEKEKAQRFSTIIDFVHDGIIAVDTAGCITVFNTAAQKMTGFSRHEALGRRITDIIPDMRLLKVLETAKSELGDIQRLDEQTVIATNRIPVVVDGEVRGAVATYQDISEVQRLEQAIRIRLSEKGFVAQYTFSDIVHQSAAIAECIRTAQKFARYDTSVLICGPSGVGKEFFAQGIHNASQRRHSPFVAINCAALPEALIESELFGYVEGSFTGAAKKGKPGLFEMAHGGTIFLDEISELPLILQGRLLRVLQEKQVMRIGDNKLIPVDVRVVCATNRDLRNLVNHQQFRSDLYFRIAILNLYVPALNERSEDIALLSAHFVEVFGYRYRKGRMTLSPGGLDYLRKYRYDGNVRELQGMIERAVVICEGKSISRDDLLVESQAEPAQTMTGDGEAFPAGQSLRAVEDWYIQQTLRKAKGSVKECSAILGIDRTTLWRRIKEVPLAL